MSQSSENVIVLNKDFAPVLTPQELQQYVHLQNKLLESFVSQPESERNNFAAWIEQEILKHDPNAKANPDFAKQASSDILNTLTTMDKLDEKRSYLRSKGATDQDIFTAELLNKINGLPNGVASANIQSLINQLNAQNKKILNTYNAYSSLTPEQIASSSSVQYAVLAEIERFNSRPENKQAGLRATLVETVDEVNDPYGQIKIIDAQNEVVDTLHIRYAGEPNTNGAGAVDQEALQKAIDKIISSLDASQPDMSPIGVNVELPNGESQRVFTTIPKYSEQTISKEPGHVFFEKTADHSPFNNYFVFPENLPAQPKAYQSWTPASIQENMILSTIEMPYGVSDTLDQTSLKDTIEDIVRSIRQSALFNINYSKYFDIAGEYAIKGAKLSAQAAKFVAESLISGSIKGLQIVSSLALKFSSFTWNVLKDINYKEAALVAGGCVKTCAKAVYKTLCGLFNLGSKAVGIATDKISRMVKSGDKSEIDVKSASDVKISDEAISSNKPVSSNQAISSSDSSNTTNTPSPENSIWDELTEIGVDVGKALLRTGADMFTDWLSSDNSTAQKRNKTKSNSPKRKNRPSQQQKTQQAPSSTQSSSSSSDWGIVDSFIGLASTALGGFAASKIPFVALSGLNPILGLVVGSAVSVASATLGHKVKECFQDEAKQSEVQMQDLEQSRTRSTGKDYYKTSEHNHSSHKNRQKNKRSQHA